MREREKCRSIRFTGYQKLGLLFITVYTLLFLSAPAIGSVPTAMAVKVSGSVSIMDEDGKTKPCSQGQQLQAGAILVTGPDGRVTLDLGKNGTLEVFEESRLSLSDITVREKPSFSISFYLGRLLCKLKKIVGDDVVVTPNLICGVRGTEFSVGVTEDGASLVTVDQGSVGVSTDGTTEAEEVRIVSGQEVEAEAPDSDIVPRPTQVRSEEDWRSYRKNRFFNAIPRMPKMADQMEAGLDGALQGMDSTIKEIRETTDRIKINAAKARSLGPGKSTEREEIFKAIAQDRTQIARLTKRFRIKRVRLRNTFFRAQAIKNGLERNRADIPEEAYTAAAAGMDKVLARKANTVKQVQTNFYELRRLKKERLDLRKQGKQPLKRWKKNKIINQKNKLKTNTGQKKTQNTWKSQRKEKVQNWREKKRERREKFKEKREK